jgi:hypothetical protein
MGYDDFDYAKIAKGGLKTVTGIVKAVYPVSGPGLDQAQGGLFDALRAAGLSTDEEGTPPASPLAQLDQLDRPKTPPGGQAPPPPATPSQPQSDRQITEALLLSRRWTAQEVAQILAGPQTGPPQPGRRLPLEGGTRLGTEGARVPGSIAYSPERQGHILTTTIGVNKSK